jgi:hypothetical protein
MIVFIFPPLFGGGVDLRMLGSKDCVGVYMYMQS